jgi:TolB-like protein/DNA-binding winged helix-turn-helix (wHTH) protein/tetratricopeptide (TPR) repeat protein
MASTGPSTSIRFGAFELDAATGVLRKGGIAVKLHPQPFRVLQLLVENPGQPVTREEIRHCLWGENTFVDFERGINFCVNQIRTALGDDADNPKYVETLPRCGYRFIASLNGANDDALADASLPAAVAPPISAPRFRALPLTAAAVLLAVIAAFGLNIGGLRSRLLAKRTPPAIRSLAVLPLQNLSNDPEQEYFSDGMTDALTTDLSQVSALRVISRTSAMRYKKTDKSLPQIGRELGVDAVVEGTVQRSGNHVRITAQLIQAETDKHLWARSYERDMQDILSLQGDIARTIAQEISVEVKPREQLRMTRVQPVNLKAVDAYLQGQYHYQKAKDIGYRLGTEQLHQQELNQAIAFFQRAVAEDPSYARAYLGMAEIWAVPATFPYPPTAMEQPAREALARALAIDPDLAEAYVDLGRIDYRYWNWSALEQEAKHAIEINPNLAPAHYLYSSYLGEVGRMDEAMEEAELTQALDPDTDRVAWVFYCQRRFDRFIEIKRSYISRHAFDPRPHFDLGYGYERAHMYKEAVDEWEQAMIGFGYDDLAKKLRRGYMQGGFRGAMRAWVAGWETIAKRGGAVQPDRLAYLYSILGDNDRAFAWLEKSMQMHTTQPPALKIDPTVDELRSDPRFADLLRRVGLPQ